MARPTAEGPDAVPDHPARQRGPTHRLCGQRAALAFADAQSARPDAARAAGQDPAAGAGAQSPGPNGAAADYFRMYECGERCGRRERSSRHVSTARYKTKCMITITPCREKGNTGDREGEKNHRE